MTARSPRVASGTRPARRTAPTSLVNGPAGRIEYLSTGTGQPCTVFAHGLGGTIDTTRPFGSGVAGRRVFIHLRGYGASDAGQSPWSYQAIGQDVRAVADHVRATRALGVSMGAGALCALLEETPTRFERVVFMLPAVLDRPRTDGSLDRLIQLRDLSEAGDLPGIEAYLLAEQPAQYQDTPAVRSWVTGHAKALAGVGSLHALRALPHVVPIAERAALRQVTAEVLVVGQEADVAHPAPLARELATLFTRSHLVVLPAGGALWGHRARVRALLSDFLA